MAGVASSICQSALGCITKINNSVALMHHADRLRDQIVRKTEDIQSQLQRLRNHSDDQFTTDMTRVLQEVFDRLHACEERCQELADQWRVKQFLKAASNNEALQLLQVELDHVHDNLESQVICAISEQVSAVKMELKDGITEVRRDTAYPQAGLYPICSLSSGVLKPPDVVSKPVVDMKGETMIVRWKDSDNPPGSIDMYEVRIDDSKNIMFPCSPKYKSLCIGPPKIEPGILYTIQVRGANGRGPGEWSEKTEALFKTGPPKRPDKPKVIPSYTDAKISVRIPDLKEANGTPVEKITVQYCEYDNSGNWESETLTIEKKESQRIHEFLMHDLSPNTRYFFRVILINESGESSPSESVDITTDVPIPGKPTNIRPSSYFTSDMIKIRWNPPIEYPEFVDHYEVQYKRRKDESDSSEKYEVIQTTKLSAKASGLKSDTWYVFHVKAVNKNRKFGESARVEAETRWKKAAKAVLSPFVFIGGTVGGPVLGAIGGGSIAAENADTKVGSVAGAVGGAVGGGLLGTVGAPALGATCAHLFVHGSVDSDQSDDEN
uniref:Fibronectin type-III domain-containing protein n=1 Tax=Amphimedon queenslandica TaxID=400682 RepID=A0A1X7U3U5_AMPQE